MATLYGDAVTGALMRVLLTATEEAQYPAPPAGAGAPLVFDPTTNPALVADLRASTDPYRLVTGALTKSGQAVAINPPPPATVERAAATSDLQAQAATAMTALDAIIARNGTFTLAQAGQAIDALARAQRRILRLLVAQLS